MIKARKNLKKKKKKKKKKKHSQVFILIQYYFDMIVWKRWPIHNSFALNKIQCCIN